MFRQRCGEEDRRMLRYIAVGLIRGALESCRDNEIQYGCAVMERSLIRFLGRLGFSLSTLPGWLSITVQGSPVLRRSIRSRRPQRAVSGGATPARLQPDTADRHEIMVKPMRPVD